MSEEKDKQIAELLAVQAFRVRASGSKPAEPALTEIAVDRLRKCPHHGLHNAFFHTEDGDTVCLWCEKERMARDPGCAAESG